MLVLKYLFLTALVILFGCKQSDQPEDLIEKEKMVLLLKEIHLLEAKIEHIEIIPQDSAKAVFHHYEKMLFEEHGVTQDQYERSFTYYVEHPDQFEKIYTSVVDSLLQEEKTKSD
ncbi:MAG: hypothetical protein Tsb0034_26690 [Ekhidna sp.]